MSEQNTDKKDFNQFIEELWNQPEKVRDYLLDVMIKYKATDMYLTYNEPPSLRLFTEVIRLNKLPKMDEDTLTNIAYFFMDEFEGERFRENLYIDL